MAAVRATIVDAEEPSPAPPGTMELTETLRRGLNEYSLAIASTTRPTGYRAGLPGPRNALDWTENFDALWTSTLTLLGRAAASPLAPWTTKCSPVMMAFDGASATALIG